MFTHHYLTQEVCLPIITSLRRYVYPSLPHSGGMFTHHYLTQEVCLPIITSLRRYVYPSLPHSGGMFTHHYLTQEVCLPIITSLRRYVYPSLPHSGGMFTHLSNFNDSERLHDKFNDFGFASSDVSDQPTHPPSLNRVFTVRMKKAVALSYPICALQRL